VIAGSAPLAAAQSAGSGPPVPPTGTTGLERQKLKTETDKLDAERQKAERDNGWLARGLGILAPCLTVVVAAGTLIWTVKKGVEDLELQRTSDAEARADAQIKRFDERFTTAMTASGSDKPAERRAGAVVLDSLIRDPDREASDQGMNLLLALLQDLEQREPDASTRRVLRQTLGRRLRAPDARAIAARFDFRYLSAPGLGINGVDLGPVDLAYADLSHGNLREANLEGSRGWKLVLNGARLKRARLGGVAWAEAIGRDARFQNAILTKANFWRADLSGANCFRAGFREVNFREAKLVGARFDRAKVAGAQFRQAEFDDGAIDSLASAYGWEEAELDPAVRTRLETLRDAPKAP